MVSLFREAHHCCVLTPTWRILMVHLNSGARKSFGMKSGKKEEAKKERKLVSRMEFFPCTTDPSGEIQAVFVYIEKNAHLNAFESVSVRAARYRLRYFSNTNNPAKTINPPRKIPETTSSG
jgi:hypothetical protein